MKKVILSEIKMEGFRCFTDEVSFNLDSQGITFIKGNNGRGKTSIIEAINWCIFGTTLKGRSNKSVATWEHKRNLNWKGTRVSLELYINNIPYTIVRHLDYKGKTEGYPGKDSLMVFKLGELMDDLYKSDVQKSVIELLGVSQSMFLNSILFGQRVDRIMGAGVKNQKDFFASLFNLSYIDEARERTRKDIFHYEESLKLNSTSIVQFEAEKKGLENELIRFEETLKIFKENQSKKLETYHTESAEVYLYITELEEVIVELTSQLEIVEEKDTSSLSTLNNQLRNLLRGQSPIESDIAVFKSHIKRHEEDIKKLIETEIVDTCPKCQQTINELEVQQLIKIKETQIESLKSKLKLTHEAIAESAVRLKQNEDEIIKLKESIIEKEGELESYQVVLQKNEKVKLRISRAEVELKSNKEKLSFINRAIDMVKQEIEPTFDLEKNKTHLENVSQVILNLISQNQDITKQLQALYFWNKTGFTDNGLKFYIMSSMMDSFNDKLQYYSDILGVGVKVIPDFEGARKEFCMVCDIEGFQVDYFDISGGQKQRVDLIISMSLHDLISSSIVIFNCLFFDEAETGLDAEGMELFFEILRTKPDKSIFLITHRLESDYAGAKIIDI